jgi:hypothetical protein
MNPTDAELIASVESTGLRMADLFIANDRIYHSKDAGDFQATSSYAPYSSSTPEFSCALLSLLGRLAAPNYESIDQVSDEIEMYKEWESLYEELMTILERHGKHDPFGDGDYFLVDDCYSSPQHKVERTSSHGFTPSLVAEVQTLLKRYNRPWEVIFALPAVEGKDHAYRVFSNTCAEYVG